MGEYHHAKDDGVITSDEQVVELGDLTSNTKPGRKNPSEITICDLTGTGMQDTVIATLAYRKAVASGLGLKIDA